MSRILKSPDERRQELLDIGFDLYMQNGSSGLNVRDIVKSANVATGLFYYYFKSKEAFIEEAVSLYIERNLGGIRQILLSTDLTPVQKLERGIDLLWEHKQKMGPRMQDEALHSAQHHNLAARLLKDLCPLVQKVIEDGKNGRAFWR